MRLVDSLVVKRLLLVVFGSPCWNIDVLFVVFGSPTACSDKRDDCAEFLGRGPHGGGCQQHSEYMQMYCARSCGYCLPNASAAMDSHIVLDIRDGELLHTPVRILSSRGVRRWQFVELPVRENLVEQCGVSISGQGCDPSFSLRTHVAAGHYYDGATHELACHIFRWVQTGFEWHQMIPTYGIWGLAIVTIDGAQYLVIASYFDEGSALYRWSVEEDSFVLHQQLNAPGAIDIEATVVGPKSAFLSFLGKRDDSVQDRSRMSKAVPCQIFHWNGSYFIQFQSLSTRGGFDVEFFTLSGGRELFLCIVQDEVIDVYVSSLMAETSPQHFEHLQRLEVAHGRDAEHVRLASGLEIVAVAVFRGDHSYQAQSLIFAWSPEGRRFVEVQRLEIGDEGAFDAEYIDLAQGPTLALANQRSGATSIYTQETRADATFLFNRQPSSLSMPRAYDFAWHRVREADGALYFALASFWD